MYLEEICKIGGISGFEHGFAEKLAEIFKRHLTDVSIDPLGNVEGYLRCGKKNAPLIMLEAHFDVIGLMINRVYENGYAGFISIGGVDPRILPGMEVIIHGKKDIYGVVGLKPPHVLTAADMKKSTKIEDLTIDTGLSGKELEKLITPGDPVTFRKEYARLGKDKFSGSGLDDRAGIAAVLEAAAMLAETEKRQADVCVLAATCEETGRFGARSATSRINPDLAIIVDVTHGSTPDGIELRSSPLGKGPVLCYGPNLSRRYTRDAENILRGAGIPFGTEVEPDDPGTDAWVVQTVNCGVACMMISIPLRYMHTNIETLSLEDLNNTARAMSEFIKHFGGDENA